MMLLLLLLLLLPGLCVSETSPEPCEVDDDDFRCFCNFTAPQPDWSSAFQCMVAVEVEIHGGGRSLEPFLRGADADPKQYADMVKALRLRRLTVASAQVPAVLVAAFLRALGYSRLKELTLQDLQVTGTPPPPPLEAPGPALSALTVRNVSWATGSAWLADLQRWLKPGLAGLSVAQAHSLAFPCARLRSFPALTALDLSDNPGLGERGLASALCARKFPALQALVLRNAGLDTPHGVCAAMAAAGVQPRHLDLSRNALRAAAAGAPACAWPRALDSLNLSFCGLGRVPAGLPARLSVLDLRCNKLNRAPRPEELPKVSNLTLDGNPFLEPEAPETQEGPTTSGVVPPCARSGLAVGMSGALALLHRGGGLA